MRLDKFLSNMGIGTRSEMRIVITRGHVTVNDEVVRKAGFAIKEEKDIVLFKGERIGYVKNVYIMLNKPQGVISATTDEKQETVIDIVSETYGNRKLFPVGRLDKDTEGFLLITDDGELNHELMSPKKHVDKTYFAKVEGVVTKKTIEAFKEGITLSEGSLCKPAVLTLLNEKDGYCEIKLTITEGKFHQVKRMFEVVEMEVVYLKRESIGNLDLDKNLALGEYRELTSEELELLKP